MAALEIDNGPVSPYSGDARAGSCMEPHIRTGTATSFAAPPRVSHTPSQLTTKSDEEPNEKGKKIQHTAIDELAEALRGLNLEENPWQQLCAMVMTNDVNKQYEGTKGFRMLLSVLGEIPIQEVIDTGVVPKFVSFLERDDDALNGALQFEAAWALTNIASGTSIQTEMVVNAGGIQRLLKLLGHPSEEIREQGMWGLGNIAGDRPEYRDAILSVPGATERFLEACKMSRKLASTRTGIWSLSNMCRGKPRPSFSLVAKTVPYLSSVLLYSTDPESISDACWALDGIGETPDGLSAIIHCGVMRRLIQLLESCQPAVQRPALRVIGQIATGSTSQTQTILSEGALPALVALLSSDRKSIRRDVCWTLSNIAAGTTEQLQVLIANNAIPTLVKLFYSDEETDVRKEASWAIANACTTHDRSQLGILIESGCTSPVCDILQIDDAKILEVVLDALHNILSFGVEKANELGLKANPCCALIEESGGTERLMEVHSSAESTGKFVLWQKTGYILQTYLSKSGMM